MSRTIPVITSKQRWEHLKKTRDPKISIDTIKEGTGKKPNNGDTISVHYTGKLENGTKFDSSYDRGQPFTFVLGMAQVINGWDQAFLDINVGTKATLTIPPRFAYREKELPGIPPHSTLIFEVELMEIK